MHKIQQKRRKQSNTFAGGVNRREFLTQAAFIGLSASGAAAFLEACSKLGSSVTPVASPDVPASSPGAGMGREMTGAMEEAGSEGYAQHTSVNLDTPPEASTPIPLLARIAPFDPSEDFSTSLMARFEPTATPLARAMVY